MTQQEKQDAYEMAISRMADAPTLRDHFAASALNGLLAAGDAPIDMDEAAKVAYRYADAMILARDPRPESACETCEKHTKEPRPLWRNCERCGTCEDHHDANHPHAYDPDGCGGFVAANESARGGK